MELFKAYVDVLPVYVLSWRLYAVLALCLALEAFFFVRKRPLLSVELAQDFVFGAIKRWLFLPMVLAYTAFYQSAWVAILPAGYEGPARVWPPWVQFTVAFLSVDLFIFATHVALHKVETLWHFHTIHHSQRNLNPFTTHRVHLLENLFKEPIQFLPLALLGVGYPTWIGLRTFHFVWSHFIHSNVRWNLGPLRWVLVSPQFHRIHHSVEPRHQDKNFGERLVIWDWIFGTLHPNAHEYPETGVAGVPYPVETSVRGLSLLTQAVRQYVYPFRMIGRGARALTSPG